ncbi:glycoside hydrolase family 78 protein [Phototrophicus methaneseepsis]|uniref:alpha-L-rhamnosidase n=1 Tax=Phototrophicus methaneseepsis TaxID=2710758 RepID=A0A7S8EDD9_9CHLR|nr:glycoside hydrolase family 78 protein [Phototrophicus methaneseepsis]QPC84683.1 glycoside hydrolase family 78 protein [Phototrophicus methaneseepsis]
MTKITNLTCEYRTNPIGIDIVNPRLSWQMQTERQGARQTAYRILVASTIEQLTEDKADYLDSDKIESDQSVQVAYEGQALTSRQRVYWKVQVWDETGTMNESDVAWFEMGLLESDDWQSQWIGANLSGGVQSMIPVPYFRKDFALEGDITSARLYITALGVFECSINGQAASNDVFAPGWTDYNKRVQYLTYDVTSLLKSGDNTIGAVLGDGWAAGYVAWAGRQNYVDRPQLMAQLEVTFGDGTRKTIASDGSWMYQYGPITHSDFQMGEAYDARKERQTTDTSDWMPVQIFSHTNIDLTAQIGPTVQQIQELSSVIDPIDRGGMSRSRWVFDLGQNMVGRVRFKGIAPAGTTVTFRFAEILDADDTLYTTNLRSARATDYYTFKGEGEETWESKFTFHGFRYVEIEGYHGDVSKDTITGIVLHSAMKQTGTFECSDPLLNQLQSNILWGQKGNFLELPTDCPQRDERLGWTGDIQVFAETATFNMDIAGFMTRWALNVRDAQNPDGSVPAVVPYAGNVPTDGGPAWADATIICPWTVYKSYGDKRILEENYESMNRFMDFIVENSPGYIRCAPDYEGWHGFGDWLSVNANTPRDFIGTAFLAYDASLMVKIASVLDKPDDVAHYQQLFEDTKAAFANHYLVGSEVSPVAVQASELRRELDAADKLTQGNLAKVDYGDISSTVFNTDLFTPTQTAYVLALYFDLLPDDLRSAAIDELVADIEGRGTHLSTGFVGSPYLNYVLSQNGRLDTAYDLLNQKTWPSWLYAVTQGATTIWERWDGWTEDKGFQTPEMNSFNHYAYGAIGAWMYSTIAGINIDPLQPGYKHFSLSPQPGGGLAYAHATLETAYGEIVSDWKYDGNTFTYNVVVPPNTTATVTLPVTGKGQLNGKAVQGQSHLLDAGQYEFVVEI